MIFTFFSRVTKCELSHHGHWCSGKALHVAPKNDNGNYKSTGTQLTIEKFLLKFVLTDTGINLEMDCCHNICCSNQLKTCF